MMISNGPMCGRVLKTGRDSNILGRWSWIILRGCKGVTLVIATLYRPVINTRLLSTYQQHKNVLRDQDMDVCPRKKLLDDLALQIQIWKNE
jgi:hypothetical protein